MKIFHMLNGYSLAGLMAASASFISRAVDYAVAAAVAFIETAFPASAPPELAYAMASAPRVTGLHETRSFQQRLDQISVARRRAPLSSAFAAL